MRLFRNQRTTQVVLWAFTLTSLLWPVRAVAGQPNVGQLMQMPGFRNLVLTIAMVNKAMRDAAESPLDQWRRRNVQIAVGLLPQAIIGLAQVFKQGQLHDKDLPAIQAILGGFVDVNAADNYKKFLINPDKRLIPKTGDQFPSVAPPPVPNVPDNAVAAAPGKAEPAVGGAAVGQIGKNVDAPPSGELANLNQKTAENLNSKASAPRVGFDDSAEKNQAQLSASSNSVKEVASTATSVSTGAVSATVTAPGSVPGANPAEGTLAPPTSTLLETATREISQIESKIEKPSSLKILPLRQQTNKDHTEDSDVFKGIGRNPVQKKTRASLRGQAEPNSGSRLRVQPKYWRVIPVLRLLEEALLPRAQAEGGGGGGGGGCAGGCGGEEGKGGGGGGEAAGQILMGIAAIIAAIAPMVVAKIQAEADVKIATINAETQKTLTTITANTSKYLADQQKEVALTQSQIAENISKRNNDAVTERLELQLAELRAARKDAEKAEQERRALEQQYNQQRIQLAQQQAAENLKLAKATLNAQLTQAGLSQGFSNSTNSGDRLGVSRSGVAGGGSLGASPAGAGSAVASANATGNGPAAGTEGQAPTGTAFASRPAGTTMASLLTKGPAPTGSSGANARAAVATEGAVASSAPRAQLLRSLQSRGIASVEEEICDPKIKPLGPCDRRLSQRGTAGRLRGVRGARAASGVVSVGRSATTGQVADRLAGMMLGSIVSGSTAAAHRAFAKTPRSSTANAQTDLLRFLGGNEGFTEFRAAGGPARGIRRATAHPDTPDESKGGKAYNQPEGHSPDGASNSFETPNVLLEMFPGLGGPTN